MAQLSKYTFNDATIGVAFSDTITIILDPCPPPTGPLEVLVDVTMTAVSPALPTGILPGLDPGYPNTGDIVYIPTATPSTSLTISMIGTLNETYFDEREWEYRDDTTGKSYHTPVTELTSSTSDGGRIYTVNKNNVQPDAYTTGGEYETDIPNPVDTLIRYKPDFRASRTVTYTYTIRTICAGVPTTYVYDVTQNILNNWDLGRDKMNDIVTNKVRYT